MNLSNTILVFAFDASMLSSGVTLLCKPLKSAVGVPGVVVSVLSTCKEVVTDAVHFAAASALSFPVEKESVLL